MVSTPERFAAPAVDIERRRDGTLIARSPIALGGCARCIGDWLEHWANHAPEKPFLLERAPGMHSVSSLRESEPAAWRTLTYGDVRRQVRRIASGLLARRLSAERPIVILSENGVDHALLTLAAMHVGVPVAPVSPAYSLLSRDFAKLKSIVGLLQPGLVFASDPVRFADALAAIDDVHRTEVVAADTPAAPGVTTLAMLGTPALGDVVDEVDAAFAAVGPDTIAKFLFTSGSTGNPKAVVNTQRMLTANQQAKLRLWPFLATEPPVIVDWLPWSHTFGANHNFNMVLANGGTLYIDGGKPMPGAFDQTIANLREISPTIYFNVPRGYDMLIHALRGDAALRSSFFRRLSVLFYAGAALPQNLWEALGELARAERGDGVPLVTSWGATETAPLATDCHWQAPRSGVIGNPVPGTELKLVPQAGADEQYEIRVRGPNVTPGYWKQPELTAQAFDDEGFYRIGDAVRFFDASRPAEGLVFDGRIAEDFKLATGTRVNVGALRIQAIAALAPVAQDIVVTGHDGDACGFLVFPNLAACREIAGLPPGTDARSIVTHATIRAVVTRGLAALRDRGGGSSTFATRALVLVDPPSIDAGEITDKGYINQRAVRERRKDLVAVLHGEIAGADVIVL